VACVLGLCHGYVLGCKTVYVSVCATLCACMCTKARAGHRVKFQDVIFSTLKA
jgi:hypothetical protein